MTHNEIIKELSQKIGKTQKETRSLLASLVDIVSTGIDDGKVMRIPGLGAFQEHTLDERKNYNPGDKKHYLIPKKRTVHFAPGATLKANLPQNPIGNDG